MKRHQFFALAAVALVACVDGGRSSGPNFAISDAAHGGATPGFYFLPPIVPQPAISEPFNAFLQPLVRICPLDDADNVVCGSAPIRFTSATGPGSETIRVSTQDKHYIVNWHTDQPPAVEPGQRYRIEIFADRDGTVLLGFADVKIAATGKEAKNITNGSEGETIGLVDGKTLAIKFFAGLGALGQCDPDGPTCAEAIVSPEDGGLVVAVNADGEAEAFADFPGGWTDEPTTVMLERIVDDPTPLGAPEGLHQWPLFYEFTAFVVREGEEGPVRVPAGQFTRRVRIGVCNIDNALGDPDHPEDRGTISLGIGRGDHFRTLPAADATDILGLCDGITLAAHSGAGASGWRAFLARAAAVATDVFLPRPLHARAAVVVDGGAGGSTDSFESPVGTVEGRPDLVVDEIRISPTSPEPGDAITITAEIRNVGRIHAGRTLVTIDVDGQSPFERELSCPNLDEGEVSWTASLAPFDQSEESCFVSRTVSFEAAGDFTVTARADAVGDLATESNEENNASAATFTVAAALRGLTTDPTGDVASGEPDLVTGTASVSGGNLTLSVRFAQGTFSSQTTLAQFLLDTDANPSTGTPGSDAGGINDAGIIGWEFLVEMGSDFHGTEATIRRSDFQSAGTAVVSFVSNGMDVTIPLSVLGGDDGQLTFKVVTFSQLTPTTFTGVLDYMPNVGQPAAVLAP